MAKKGPLGKAEEFYIKHNYKTMDVDQICKELDRAKSLVKRHVAKCTKEDEEQEAKERPTAGFAHSRGATVMTNVASEMGDANRQAVLAKSTSRQNNCTTRIR